MREIFGALMQFGMWAWTAPFAQVWPFIEQGLSLVAAFYVIRWMWKKGQKK